MSKPSEHKSVQARILEYAEKIGWKFVVREQAEKCRGFDPQGVSPRDRAKTASLYFLDTLHQKVQDFNPKFSENIDDLIRRFSALTPDIYGNRDFLAYLKGEKTFYHEGEKRELNLRLIDFDNLKNNVFEVTEEFYFFNGKYANREDVVFLINGIPVLVIECKNATKDEAIAIGIDQLRRYHEETPEMFVPEQIFTATESIGFSYGVTWNLIRRNIFNWKEKEVGNLESKIKSFCDKKQVLDMIEKHIMFAEKDEELNKYILRQHQQIAVDKVMERAQEKEKQRGLVWHTQGSGKTYTMIKTAELLFKSPKSDKPTILLMIDRNELEDQMIKNLASLGMKNVEHASSIRKLNQLLKDDYRGVIVTTIHKFRDMPSGLNKRENIYVLVDEAHRTTGGDLGNFLMAGLPKATFIGFTGTPIDKTAYGKGTFKTFGIDDKKGYLHKYSIADSIEDGTTLPLFYSIAPNKLLVPKETLEEEFLKLSQDHGVTDIEELNKILERAVNTKNFLKGKQRVDEVAKYVANHFKENVEPLGYKAFLVGVDREACALYKKALDKYLPADYSQVVYTASNNDTALLKEHHHDEQTERNIRKNFIKFGIKPKILIVTEKLLTGYDAPILYAMYLDKPMRDHALLQAIARVNRPYENEEQNMVKPHGFILDFIGIFDKVEKALAFDSDEISAVIKDIQLLKALFETKMNKEAKPYLELVSKKFTDKDTDHLIEHFRDPEKRKKLFKAYKEIEMLYEIISPDAFLRPFIDDYGTLSAIYGIVRNAYAKKVYVDREFQRKTNELVRKHVGIEQLQKQTEFFEINHETIERIKEKNEDDNVKIINLIKSIERIAEQESEDLFLISLLERAEEIKELYESRQITTKETLDKLQKLLEEDIERRRHQAEKGFDSLTYFVFQIMNDQKIPNSEKVTEKIKKAFIDHKTWKESAEALRELRAQVYYAILSEEDDINKATSVAEELFRLLSKAYDI
jgi:type I restriction enzyme R subunit